MSCSQKPATEKCGRATSDEKSAERSAASTSRGHRPLGTLMPPSQVWSYAALDSHRQSGCTQGANEKVGPWSFSLWILRSITRIVRNSMPARPRKRPTYRREYREAKGSLLYSQAVPSGAGSGRVPSAAWTLAQSAASPSSGTSAQEYLAHAASELRKLEAKSA